MTTIVLRGRTYSVESFVHTNSQNGQTEKRYRLTGKRGASFFTMRNVNRPDALENVWLSDADGTLRVLQG